jgi:hypothetical protein
MKYVQYIGIMIAMLLIFTPLSFAYESDFKLDGSFLVEVHREQEEAQLQIWHIKMQRGLIEGEEAFIDFSLVAISLVHKKEETLYTIKYIDIYNYDPTSTVNSLFFTNNTFNFEFGIVTKRYIKISFNQDGTLASITGSILDKRNPAKVATFKLSEDQRQVHIIQDNNFLTKDYLYNYRAK